MIFQTVLLPMALRLHEPYSECQPVSSHSTCRRLLDGLSKIIHRRPQPLRHHEATKPLGLKESLWVHGGLLLVLWLAISFRIFG